MKFRSLFDIVGDAKDVGDFFDGVETVEQMISKLERIKKREADEFLVCIQSLRISVETAMDDTLEMGGSVDPDDTEPDLTEEELGELGKDEDEKVEEGSPEEVAKG